MRLMKRHQSLRRRSQRWRRSKLRDMVRNIALKKHLRSPPPKKSPNK